MLATAWRLPVNEITFVPWERAAQVEDALHAARPAGQRSLGVGDGRRVGRRLRLLGRDDDVVGLGGGGQPRDGPRCRAAGFADDPRPRLDGLATAAGLADLGFEARVWCICTWPVV